jgi:tetratricopeptide (TPR) repeat protein
MKVQLNDLRPERPAGFNPYAWKTFVALAEKIQNEAMQWNEVTPVPCREFYQMICDKNGNSVISLDLLHFIKNEWNAEWQEHLLIEAKQFIRKKQYNQAIPLLQLAERIFQMNEEVLLYIAICHQKEQRIHSSLHYYHVLLQHFPHCEAGFSRRALLYYQLDQDAKAYADIQRALMLNPASTFALRLKIGLDAVARKFDEAEQAAFQLIYLQPEVVSNYEKLADVQLLMHKKQSALSTLEMILNLDPNNAYAHFELAHLLAGKDNKKARLHMETAYKLGYRNGGEAQTRLVA